MAFATPARPNAIAEMNITPLVDVMLVLLIIFMVAAPILSGRVTLNLPIPDPKAPPPPLVEPVTLRIEADGSLLWNGEPMSAKTVEAVMRIEASRAEPPVLEIEVAEDATYEHVAAVLGRARHAGLQRIAIP